MSDGLLPGFKGLDGIDEPKDVQARPLSALEKLLQIGEDVVKEYAPKKLIEMLDYDICDFYENDEYLLFYEDVKQRLHETCFDEEDLQSVVLTKANIELGVYEYLVLGMYTGCLAQLLTERNRTQGKRTKIHIDGKGNIFHFLFLFARNVDDIIVENLKGSWICGYVASHKGHANDIIGVNLEGYAPLAEIGSEEGKVNRLVGLKITGRKVMNNAFSNGGCCSQIIGVGIKGGYSNLGFIGSANTSKRGTIKQLIIVDAEEEAQTVFGVGSQGNKINQVIAVKVSSKSSSVLSAVGNHTEILQVIGAELKGNGNFHGAGDRGYIHQLYGINIEGKGAFFTLGYDYGNLGTVVAIDVKGENTFSWHSDQEGLKNGPRHKNIKKIIHYGCTDISDFVNAYTNNVVSGDKALAEYRQLSQKHHIEEIINLAKSMEGKSYPEVLDIGDKLYVLQPDFTYDLSLHKKHLEDNIKRVRRFIWWLYFDTKNYLKDKLHGFRDYLLGKTEEEKDNGTDNEKK